MATDQSGLICDSGGKAAGSFTAYEKIPGFTAAERTHT